MGFLDPKPLTPGALDSHPRLSATALSATIDTQIEVSPELAGPYSAPSARLDILEPALDARRYVGENTDTGLDVTTQLQAWLDTLVSNNREHHREAFLPAGTYNVSAPLRAPDGAKIIGQGSSGGGVNMMASRIKALPGFVGDTILKSQNAGAGTSNVSSWHWGGIERICIIGNGITGPDGINPGSMGEASFIRDTLVQNVKDGIYLSGAQASAHIENCSVMSSRYGVNMDGASSTVRLVGFSGDNNVSLIRAKGGVSLSVAVLGLKCESSTTDTTSNDPVIRLEDFEGSLLVMSAWTDAHSARNDFLKISKTTTTNNPKVTLLGVDVNGQYANLINDTILGKTLSANPAGNKRPAVFWNESVVAGGGGAMVLENGLAIRGRNSAGTYQALVVAGSDNSTDVRALGSGGGRLSATGGGTSALRWGTDGTTLGFYGATPVAKPALTYSRTGESAQEAALRGVLASLGLVTDSTVA